MQRQQVLVVAALFVGWGLVAPAAAAPAAAPAVDVWGDGPAAQCASAARDGESGAQYEQVCNEALEKELLSVRDRAGALVNRGVLKMRDKRYTDALADFDMAIREQSNLAEAYVNRSAARIGAHQYRDSILDADNALLLGVKEPEKAYYNRAVADEWLDDYAAAWADYQKALALAPDWDLLRQQMARFKFNHPIEALPILPSLTSTPPR